MSSVQTLKSYNISFIEKLKNKRLGLGLVWEVAEAPYFQFSWSLLGNENFTVENRKIISIHVTTLGGQFHFKTPQYVPWKIKQIFWELTGCLYIEVIFSKMSGDKNPVYSTNIFNFYLALSKTPQKSFEFVSGNRCRPDMRQIKKAARRGCSTSISFNEEIIK